MNPLFDFSELQVGQKLTRIIYNLWISKATVSELTDTTVKCIVIVDIARSMVFDRRTGVNVHGSNFGLIVNKIGEGRAFVEKLKRELRDSLDKNDLLPATRQALEEQLSQDS
jgi:hypothetical protein